MRVRGALRARVSMLCFAFALAAMPAGASASGASCSHADSAAGTASAADLSAATACLVNAERAAAGLEPLASNGALARTAEAYAGEMVASRRFAHTDASGGNVADRVLAVSGSLDPWLELGENLGWGTLDQATPRSVVAGWMNSPTHRDNILYARFSRLGVGIAGGVPAAGPADGLTYVTVFGRAVRRKPAKPKRCSRARTRAATRKTRSARTCRRRR